MSWERHDYANDRSLVAELADEIGGQLQAAIVCRDRATLAVSGGSTPKALFARLSSMDIEWDKVTVTLVDERWVDEQSPDSNAGLVRSMLLKGRAAYASLISLKTGQPDPFQAVDQVHEQLGRLPWPLDVVILGMGEDGHTASFFPGARGVEEAMDPESSSLCAAVEPLSAPHQRMTLTLPAITSARHLYLHLLGERKRQVLERAVTEGNSSELPIGQILHDQDTLLHIYYAPV